MSINPTVAVVMCTYNGEAYVKEQIDSILCQTYPVSELIVQDDGSTDGTLEVVRSYMDEYPIVKLYANKHNLGFNENFRTACLHATSDYIALADQDDVWYPTKIEKQIAAIGGHDICFTCHHRGRDRAHVVYVTPQYSLEALLFTGFAGHTMLLKADFAKDEKNWISYIHYDWSLAISAQLGKGIVRVDEPLNWHRSHEGSAIDMEQKRFGKEFKKKLTYQPYLYGPTNYRTLQGKENWKRLYTFIAERTSRQKQPLAHRMAKLMLKRSGTALLRLCWLCMKHRDTIYWNGNAKGVMGKVRSFAYPFIFAYNNVQYDL